MAVRGSALIGVLFVPLCFLRAAAESADLVSVHYDNRPPLVVTMPDGGVGGIVGEPAARIFATAGLSVRWVRTPPRRSYSVLANSNGNDCSFGWFKTSEREKFSKYSLPYYLDLPPSGIVRADFPVADGQTVRDLLARPQLVLTLRYGIAYGDYLEELIARMARPRAGRLDVDSVAIAKMIQSRHSDLTILPSEEVQTVIANTGLPPSSFRILNFPDLPARDYRYIVCSFNTASEVMDRINQAIRKLDLP